MTASLPGDAASQLRPLLPTAASLQLLSRTPSPTYWDMLRHDPGLALLLVTCLPELWRPAPFSLQLLTTPRLLQTALAQFQEPGAVYFDARSRPLQPIVRYCRTLANHAWRIAWRTQRWDAELAWVAGLLAPLGWYALGATSSATVAACLQDHSFLRSPADSQRHYFGRTACEIARRLARRWQLPPVLHAVVGHVELPLEQATVLGGHPDLQAILQLAVYLTHQQLPETPLLPVPVQVEAAQARLNLDDASLASPTPMAETMTFDPANVFLWQDPRDVPLLADLLHATLENRLRASGALIDQLEGVMDELHQVLVQTEQTGRQQLRDAKLASLAEFAAGAGHEINNPLAVISGQAQYLLSHEEATAKCQALRSIVRQSQRIASVLSELMLFARPTPPQPSCLDLAQLCQQILTREREVLATRQIRLELQLADPLPAIFADPRHTLLALQCLVRNAIEAVPEHGLIRISAQRPCPHQLEVVVEDSGPGPEVEQREHLFDPFFSGRAAGRGRGLGLSTAWRLVQINGGELDYLPEPGHPARFILRLPLVVPLEEVSTRRSA